MKKLLLLFVPILLGVHNLNAQLDTTYTKHLLCVKKSVDYFPVWGESDNVIYVNIASKEWREYNLKKCVFVPNEGMEGLGMADKENYKVVKDNKLIARLQQNKDWKPRVLNVGAHKLELPDQLMGTELLLDGKTVLPISGNAHSLAVSPSGKYVAFIYELAGLMIIDLEAAVARQEAIAKQLLKMTNLEKAAYYVQERDLEGLEKTLSAFTAEEKETKAYSFYSGLAIYVTDPDEQELIDKAIEHLQKVEGIYEYLEANLMLAALHQKKGNWEKVLHYADMSIELEPREGEGYYLKGEYYRNKGKVKKACELYLQAHNLGEAMAQFRLIECDRQ